MEGGVERISAGDQERFALTRDGVVVGLVIDAEDEARDSAQGTDACVLHAPRLRTLPRRLRLKPAGPAATHSSKPLTRRHERQGGCKKEQRTTFIRFWPVSGVFPGATFVTKRAFTS
jgi:hypothetical protein